MAAIGEQIAVDDGTAGAPAHGPYLLVRDRFATITNHDAVNSVFLGGPTVTAATGYELKPGITISVDAAVDLVYGVCAATKTARVDVLTSRRAYR